MNSQASTRITTTLPPFQELLTQHLENPSRCTLTDPIRMHMGTDMDMVTATEET